MQLSVKQESIRISLIFIFRRAPDTTAQKLQDLQCSSVEIEENSVSNKDQVVGNNGDQLEADHDVQ